MGDHIFNANFAEAAAEYRAKRDRQMPLRDPATFDYPPKSKTFNPAEHVEADGGDDGPYTLKPGEAVKHDLDGRTGKVVRLECCKAYVDGVGFVSAKPGDPDALFHEAKVAWSDGTVSNAKTLHLRPADATDLGAKFFSAASLKDRPVAPRDSLVEGLIPSQTVTLLGGDGGTGKSLLALQLAVAVAADCPWIGLGVKQGRAVYLSAEDDAEELHRRLDAIIMAEGLSYDELEGLTLRSLAGRDALLASIPAPGAALKKTRLFDEVVHCLEVHRPALLVLDTLADLFPGNENDRAQARQFIGLLRGLAIEHNCAVVLLAHPSLSGLNSGTGTSGSTGWNNSVRSRLYLERVTQDGNEANPDARVLRTMKSNYGRIGGEIAMTWRDGVFVADQAETGLDRMANGAKAERVFLKLLRLFTEQGRRVNANGGVSYAPKAFADHPEAEGVRKAAFRNSMEALMAKGAVAQAMEGPPSRRVSYLVEVKK